MLPPFVLRIFRDFSPVRFACHPFLNDVVVSIQKTRSVIYLHYCLIIVRFCFCRIRAQAPFHSFSGSPCPKPRVYSCAMTLRHISSKFSVPNSSLKVSRVYNACAATRPLHVSLSSPLFFATAPANSFASVSESHAKSDISRTGFRA